jgi:hypothetical protein
MKDVSGKILFWSPRILTILFALFISIFALDVLEEGLGFFRTLLAFMIHLIPSSIIIIVLIISWRKEWIGGVVFAAFTIFYIYLTRGRFPISVYFVICVPMVLISILFFINWFGKVYKEK